MVFCAYCGKSFTRKEHLERHIPSHTNVKPHRCSACQLSFARRDLLQRHHATYHEARDPMEPLPGSVPTVAGRTPIACQNCANAKTGCDKRVPCSRCAEKNLPCAARFARRSSKAAVRAAQASAAFQHNMIQQRSVITAHQSPQSPQVSFMNLDPSLLQPQEGLVMVSPTASPVGTIDPRMTTENPLLKSSQSNSQTQSSPDPFPSPHNRADSLEEFIPMGNEFVPSETAYQDLLMWSDYPIELDMYSSTLPFSRGGLPLPTPPFTEQLSDVSCGSEPMTTTSSGVSIHTRRTSTLSGEEFETPIKPVESRMEILGEAMIPEFEVVIAAETAWPLARCNPPIFSGTCPRTAIVHLECLEQKSKEEGTWASLEKYLEQVEWDASDVASVVPMTARTRDKMLAITQSFLHKALEIHRGGLNGYAKTGYPSPGNFNFIVLPPNKTLEFFLRSYVRSLSFYYTLVIANCVDPNEMLSNDQASTLLVLLMIAQGTSAVPMAEARYLAAGLTETCRISLFDIIEKNIEFSADPVALRCALLFTILGAWSGDKWLMDIAMGQRGMYLAMLKHAGMMEPQEPFSPILDGSTSSDLQWRSWLQRELQNRLVYNWAMVDQELSLFHDTGPMLSITDLQCPLPSPEILWMSGNAEQWFTKAQSFYCETGNTNPRQVNGSVSMPSLYDLFQDFLHDNLSKRLHTLSPYHMRLLLHPIQSLLCHLRQTLSCFSDVLSTRRAVSTPVTKASTMCRLEEVQGVLQKWYDLSVSISKDNPQCGVTRCNLILYHLISLNAVTNFPEVERLARKEGLDGTHWGLSLRHKRCIYNREEAIFHCGQVLRLVRAMKTERRPCWWPAAIYRAILIMWVDSISRADQGCPSSSKDQQHNQQHSGTQSPVIHQMSPPNDASPVTSAGSMASSRTPSISGQSPKLNNFVAIDQLTPEDSQIVSYLWTGEGVPVVTLADGTTVPLDKPSRLLSYGLTSIDQGVSTRIGDGIKRKLIRMGNNWDLEGFGPTMTS